MMDFCACCKTSEVFRYEENHTNTCIKMHEKTYCSTYNSLTFVCAHAQQHYDVCIAVKQTNIYARARKHTHTNDKYMNTRTGGIHAYTHTLTYSLTCARMHASKMHQQGARITHTRARTHARTNALQRNERMHVDHTRTHAFARACRSTKTHKVTHRHRNRQKRSINKCRRKLTNHPLTFTHLNTHTPSHG